MRNFVGERRGDGGTFFRSSKGTADEEGGGTETARRKAEDDGWARELDGREGSEVEDSLGKMSCLGRLEARSSWMAASFAGDGGRLRCGPSFGCWPLVSGW